MFAKKIKGLEINVPTQWNATYLMLEKSCTHFCQQNTEASKFLLFAAEWNQTQNIMKLLEPLSDATELLCGSKYPTLNKALPVYIVLIKHLHSACCGLYDQAQLIQPATQMINKIKQYLTEALKKPMYVCVMILDPKFKTSFWKDHQEFIINHYNISHQDSEVIFDQEASAFEAKFTQGKSGDSHSGHPSAAPRHQGNNIFSSALYQSAPEIKGIEAKIRLYLKEDIKPKDTKVLPFWASRQKSFPKLALMARRYLSIPATSAASERVFSTGRRVVSWQ
jgi:hypothetical protein